MTIRLVHYSSNIYKIHCHQVARKTKDKIKDIVSPDMLTEATRVLLVNAIYFQVGTL